MVEEDAAVVLCTNIEEGIDSDPLYACDRSCYILKHKRTNLFTLEVGMVTYVYNISRPFF